MLFPCFLVIEWSFSKGKSNFIIEHSKNISAVSLHFIEHINMLKYAKTTNILNYFECYFIYAKVCKIIKLV